MSIRVPKLYEDPPPPLPGRTVLSAFGLIWLWELCFREVLSVWGCRLGSGFQSDLWLVSGFGKKGLGFRVYRT